MALVPLASAYSMNAANFTVAADDYSAAIDGVTFTPTTQSSTWRGISGNVRRGQAPSEWSLTLGHAQDLAPEGLTRYLLDNDGQSKVVTFTPVEDGPSITATVIIAPGTIGGTAGPDTATGTATMAVDGKPAFTDPTP